MKDIAEKKTSEIISNIYKKLYDDPNISVEILNKSTHVYYLDLLLEKNHIIIKFLEIIQ